MSETARIIDGKAFAGRLRRDVAAGVAALAAGHGLTPGLAVVLVGENPASDIYVRNKSKHAHEVGMAVFDHHMAADATHDERTGMSWYEVEVAMGDALEAGTNATVWLEAAADWLRGLFPRLPELTAAPGGSHARDLALTPGMPVEVHIRTGERSPLSYLAKPLTDYFSRSLREE